LVTQGELPQMNIKGFFILTNQRLMQRTGTPFDFRIFNLTDISNVQVISGKEIKITINLKNGEQVVYQHIAMVPPEKMLNDLLKQPLSP
jgi:hypothetical protein